MDGHFVPWFLFLSWSLVLQPGFLADGVTSGAAGSPHPGWGLDFWWLSWLLVQQCVSVLVGWGDKMMGNDEILVKCWGPESEDLR